MKDKLKTNFLFQDEERKNIRKNAFDTSIQKVLLNEVQDDEKMTQSA